MRLIDADALIERNESEAVVRCKDCVNYGYNRGENINSCHKFGLYTIDSYSCAYAEKQVTGKLESVEKATSEGAESTTGQAKSKLESEKHQLSPETSTNTPTNTSTDLISRQVAIEEIALHDPTNGTEPYFSGHEVIDILKCVPTATHAKRTETHGVCSDCISRQAVFYILENKMIDRPLASDRWVIRDIGKAIESLPTVELKPVCEDAISRQAAIEEIALHDPTNGTEPYFSGHEIIDIINALPPVEDMGEVSDGYHTFNQLYHQRAVLFATIVNQNKDKAWKSWKHEDGEFCFDKGGEWFIVGVDTPEGSYTYHYEQKYWDTFDCEELDRGKQWDGHTEDDVTRLLSLPSAEPERPKVEWVSCSEPPEDRRNVFLAHGTNDFKSCCIGHYEQGMGWYEDRNFFAKPIYDCKYWCDIPDLPDMGDNQFDMRGDK